VQRYQKDLLKDNKNFAVQYREHTSRKDMMLCGHCHSHFEIYVQMSGRRCYFLKSGVYEIETGDIVIIAPGLVHKTSDIDKNAYSRLLIEFDEEYLTSMSLFLGQDIKSYFSHVYTNGYYIYRNSQQTSYIIDSCKRIVSQYEIDDVFDKMKARLSVSELILQILRESFASVQTLEVGSRYKISEILSYINENYNRDISLKEISEKFYLSYYYLSRLFKEVTGFTFVAYVNIIRVNKAKVLLEDTDKTVEVISETVGFGSQKQFVRVFKALYGVSPSKYKSTLKKERSITMKGEHVNVQKSW